MTTHRPPVCGILPPYLLRTLAQRTGEPAVARAAEHTLLIERTLRTEREVRAHAPHDRGRPPGPGFVPDRLRSAPAPPRRRPTVTTEEASEGPASPQRSVHDAEHGSSLPGTLARSEGQGPHADESVNEAYDGLGATWRLFQQEFGRDSLDGAGLPLVASVHFERDYDNAFWDGRQMVFGDGDGKVFRSFTDSLDVIGHELAHGFTQYTAGFVYVGQSGALNEHVADVFGVLTAQVNADVDANAADCLELPWWGTRMTSTSRAGPSPSSRSWPVSSASPASRTLSPPTVALSSRDASFSAEDSPSPAGS